jgi:putative transposase
MGYSSDVTNSQWAIIEPFFSGENRGKHLQKHSKRDLLNGVLYLNKTGCQWRLLPKDFPSYVTVWSFYRRALKSGLWEKILACLVKKSRENSGRSASPSYCLIDSQSVKTTSASKERGIDGGKKRKAGNAT